jgi:hypothetical protein
LKVWKLYKLNILVAYPYANPKMLSILYENRDKIRFVLDSGAFTAWKAGKPISLDDYCRFIEKIPFEPWRYFTLDIIGDPIGTLKNYEIMLQRGFKPVPIFTRGDDLSIIDEYYKTSDVVGIGGLVGTNNNTGYVKGIMPYIGDRKVHWLGFTRLNFIAHYRPYMCDSSSVASSSRYGEISIWSGNKWFRVSKKTKMDSQLSYLLKNEYNIDVTRLFSKRSWVNSGGNIDIDMHTYLNFLSYVRYQYNVISNYGSQYFLALNTSWAATFSLKALEYWISRGLIK